MSNTSPLCIPTSIPFRSFICQLWMVDKGLDPGRAAEHGFLNSERPVGGEQQREIREVIRRDQVGQALRRAGRLDLRFGLKPQLALALGENGAGRDCVYPDAVRPQRPASVLVKPTIAALAEA